MTCPKCGGETTVCGSRPTEDSVHRKRRCLDCDLVFATVEIDADLWQSITKSRLKEDDLQPENLQFNHRLTEEDVRFILANYKSCDRVYGASGLARRFNVDRKTILAIVNGNVKKWRDLK